MKKLLLILSLAFLGLLFFSPSEAEARHHGRGRIIQRLRDRGPLHLFRGHFRGRMILGGRCASCP